MPLGRVTRGLAEGLMDGIQGVAMCIKHLVEGVGEVLQQVKAIRDLDRVGGALPGPIRRGARPIPG